MRKLLQLALFLAALPTFGQTSAITATVTDSDSTAWATLNGFSATYSIQLVSASGTPVPAGQAFRSDTGQTTTNTFSGNLSSSGGLSLTLVSNSNITPASTQYRFQVCPAVSTPICGTTTLAVNSSGSLSTQLSAVAISPRISGGQGAYAYTDTEVAATPNNGYYNITTPALRCYGSAWVTCGGSSSGTVTAVTGTSPVVSSGGTTPVISCPTCNTSAATVTSVSVTTANGVSGTVATATTTPAISLTLGAINPSSVGATTAGTGAFTTVTATSALSVGATPPTACGSATGCVAFNENSVAGTPTAGEDYLRADSTTHSLLFSFNDGAEAALPTSASPTFTGTVTAPIFNATTVTSGYKLAGTAVLIFPDSDTASIAVGSGAGAAQTATSSNNTFTGTNAGHAVTSGINHTAIGNGADASATTVNENTAVGSSACGSCTGGSNTTIGNHAGSDASFSGGNNVMFGDLAGAAVTSGAGNVLIGNSAADGGTNLTTGSNNIIIGYIADGNAAGDSSEIVVAYNTIGNGNDTATIGATNAKKFFGHGTIQLSDPSAPTVSSNAGSGSLTHGTDNGGIIATGVASTTSTLTFNQGWATWASCTVSASNATAQPYVSAISGSAVTFTYVTTGTPNLYYHCFGA